MILQFVSFVKISFLGDEIYVVYLSKIPFQTVQYVIQCSRNTSNEWSIKFFISFKAKRAENNVPGFSTF